MFTRTLKLPGAWSYLNGLLLVMFAILIAGCGGGASVPAPVATTGGTDARLLPLGSPLPAMPLDMTGSPSHAVSAILDYPGAVFLNAAGGTIDGNDLVLQSTPGEAAWAMYQAGGLTGLKVDSFGVETVPGNLDTQYSVGLSNFSDGKWQYFITTSLPEAEVNLSDNTKRLTSRLGNLYYIVVVTGGNSLRMKAGHVFTSDNAGDWTPGMGNGLFVSQGLPDKIHVEWGKIDGATGYELWRKTDSGDHGASAEGAGDGFSLIDSTDGTSFDDTTALPGTGYEYKVRGTNAAGPGGFSGSAQGYMGAPPSGGGPGGDGIDVHGLIGLLSPDRLTLDGGYSFKLTDTTEWFLLDGSIGGPADFAVGDSVEVDGVKADGVLIALLVKLQKPPADDPTEVDAHGVITNLSNDRITLDNGYSFFLNGDTTWFLADGSAATKADFEVGDTVDVHGKKVGGVLTALTVKKGEGEHGGGGGAGDNFKADGTIAVREAGILTFDDGETFSYNGDTKWFDAAGNPADLLHFFTGVKVEVEGIVSGGANIAQTVRILPDGGGELHDFQGVIVSRDGGLLKMGDDLSFSWGMNTQWFLADGSVSNADAFKAGDTIDIQYETNGSQKVAVKVTMIHDISV